MAGLTKEQKAQKEAEARAKIEAEIEARIRAEYEEKLKQAIPVKDNAAVAKRIQDTKRIPLDTLVPVICNVPGGLIYVSKKIMGYTIKWDDIGSVEYMELSELSTMKNTDKRFFTDNWIVLDDTDEYTASQLYDFLKVTKFYKHIFTPETIDDIFSYSKDKIVKSIAVLSRGMKDTIAVRAKQKLDEGTLDKNIIDTLESALGLQLTF